MRKIGACFALGVFAAVFCAVPPAAAFGLRIGPFHLGLPLPGYFLGRHHRHRIVLHPPDHYSAINPRASSVLKNEDAVRDGMAEEFASDLLSPGLALPSIYEHIFWPASSPPWPFSYETIFQTAFSKAPAEHDRRACMPVNSADVIARVQAEIHPTAAQLPLLQKLGAALANASGYLAKACPNEIPAQPIARLQLAELQIEELTMALDVVRQPLQDLQQSLGGDQRKRFAAKLSAPPDAGRNNRPDDGAPNDGASRCSLSPTAVDWSVDQIKNSIQPTDAQRSELSDAKVAFGLAARDLDTHCPRAIPPSPLARLELAEARLDSLWRAVLSIRVGLAGLENHLDAEQRTRLEAVNFAAAR